MVFGLVHLPLNLDVSEKMRPQNLYRHRCTVLQFSHIKSFLSLR